MTKLHHTAGIDDAEQLKNALGSGVDLDGKDEFGATALHRAIGERNVDAALALVEGGADVAMQDRQGRTSLHWAIEHGLVDVAVAIVRRNRSVVSTRDRHGSQALWTAAFKHAERAGVRGVSSSAATTGSTPRSSRHPQRLLNSADRLPDAIPRCVPGAAADPQSRSTAWHHRSHARAL
jgi:hypothetical protein